MRALLRTTLVLRDTLADVRVHFVGSYELTADSSQLVAMYNIAHLNDKHRSCRRDDNRSVSCVNKK